MNGQARVFAIDYGERRLGIAISDPSRRVAQPLTVMERSDDRQAVDSIMDMLDDYDVSRIIVGDPRSLSGQRGVQAIKVNRFVTALREACEVPVETYDERLSSKEAKADLAAAGVTGRRAKGLVDKVAASLFLQSYLDREAGRADR